jgi:hypothetical protein
MHMIEARLEGLGHGRVELPPALAADQRIATGTLVLSMTEIVEKQGSRASDMPTDKTRGNDTVAPEAGTDVLRCA